jgi:hypothetical protein
MTGRANVLTYIRLYISRMRLQGRLVGSTSEVAMIAKLTPPLSHYATLFSEYTLRQRIAGDKFITNQDKYHGLISLRNSSIFNDRKIWFNCG